MSNGLLLLNEVIKNKYNSLFTDKTDLHLNSWTVVLLHCSICALPLHSQISRIDYSDRNRLVEARSAHEPKLSIAVTTNWFMIYYRMVNSEIITLVHLPGNYIIIIIIKNNKKNTGQWAKSAARPLGIGPVLPMASLRLHTNIFNHLRYCCLFNKTI